MTAVAQARHNCEPDRQTDGCDHFARAVAAFCRVEDPARTLAVDVNACCRAVLV